ncbi:trypsin I-P1 isoform X1 [Drosophila persimilis]|uniref:trypsin I-P1 isoform X1 n=1 Tax=Drosophila persimilis TaxID=7234 RepID=UPI000F0974C4|nr:trypsin I-P1 isoform X1 [Drosophila persimilis]
MDIPWQLQVLFQMLLSWTLVANGHLEFPFLSLSTGHTSSPHNEPSDAGKFVILPKVVGGYSITIAQVPFQVSVRRRSMHERTYGLGLICGGALISQRVVCSAAHCFAVNNSYNPVRFYGPKLFVVVAGSTQIDQADRNTKEYLVQQIIGHSDYNATTLENDIALIFLNGYVSWSSKTVRAIPLATKAQREGTTCLINGWAAKISPKVGKSGSLQQAPVPILNPSLCRAIYLLPMSQLCAGFMQGGIDACQGDSGGPLICDGQLAGIISWGVGCADPGFPGVYTNVSYFVDWIRSMNATLDYSKYLVMDSADGRRLATSPQRTWWLALAFLLIALSGG